MRQTSRPWRVVRDDGDRNCGDNDDDDDNGDNDDNDDKDDNDDSDDNEDDADDSVGAEAQIGRHSTPQPAGFLSGKRLRVKNEPESQWFLFLINLEIDVEKASIRCALLR